MPSVTSQNDRHEVRCSRCGSANQGLREVPVLADIIKRITKVVQFVKNHRGTSAIYGDKTKLRLITPCATRFATNVMVATRMLKASF